MNIKHLFKIKQRTSIRKLWETTLKFSLANALFGEWVTRKYSRTSRKGDGTRKHGILIIIFVCLSKLKFYFHDRVFPFPLYGCVYILFYIFSFIFCDFVRLFTSFITTFQFSSTVSGRLFIEKLALKLTDL